MHIPASRRTLTGIPQHRVQHVPAAPNGDRSKSTCPRGGAGASGGGASLVGPARRGLAPAESPRGGARRGEPSRWSPRRCAPSQGVSAGAARRGLARRPLATLEGTLRVVVTYRAVVPGSETHDRPEPTAPLTGAAASPPRSSTCAAGISRLGPPLAAGSRACRSVLGRHAAGRRHRPAAGGVWHGNRPHPEQVRRRRSTPEGDGDHLQRDHNPADHGLTLWRLCTLT